MIHIENLFNTHTTLLKRVKKSILANNNVSKSAKQVIRKMTSWQQLNHFILNSDEGEVIASILYTHGISPAVDKDELEINHYQLEDVLINFKLN